MTYRLPVIRDAHQRFDERVRRTMELAKKEGHTSQCKRGCSACCSEPLIASHYELPPIIEAIRAMPAHERELVWLRLKEWIRRLKHKGISLSAGDEHEVDFAKWHQQPKPVCPLLDPSTGDCLVYEARPLGCRGHISIDEPIACERRNMESVRVILFVDEAARVMAHCMGQMANEAQQTLPLLVGLLPTILSLAWPLVAAPEPNYTDWVERPRAL